jgi:hypothetical protein
LTRTGVSPIERVLQALHLTPRPEVAKWFIFTPERVQPRLGPPVPVYGRDAIPFDDYSRLLFDRLRNGRPIAKDPDAWNHKMEIQFRAHYLYDLDERHPFLRALVELGRLARANGIPVVYYFAPLNVQDLERYAGADAERLRGNVQLVARTLRRAGEPHVLDLSRLLASDDFTDKQWTCEHMTAAGRSRLAQALAEYLSAQRLVLNRRD